MKPIPTKIRQQMASENAKCARLGPDCNGRLTIEHAFGRERQKRWKLLWLCWHHHLGSGMDKGINKWLALRQATSEELSAEPKANYQQELKYLNTLYDK
jgi:hypothetical protein